MRLDTPDSFLRVLDALRDPVRLEIVLLLGRQGRLNVGAIATRFTQSRPAISHHLKVLKEAGVVQSEKLGQEIHYGVDRAEIASCLRGLAERRALAGAFLSDRWVNVCKRINGGVNERAGTAWVPALCLVLAPQSAVKERKIRSMAGARAGRLDSG